MADEDDEFDGAPAPAAHPISRPIAQRSGKSDMWDTQTVQSMLNEVKGEHRDALQTGTFETPVLELMQIMVAHKVDTIPIVQKKKKALKKASMMMPNFQGVLTSADIVDYLLRGGLLADAAAGHIFEANTLRPPEFSLDFIDETAPITLRDMVSESFLWLYTPLRGGTYIHGTRVFTVDAAGALVDAITEQDITNMINVFPPLLGESKLTVMDAWGSRELVTVRDTMNVMDAYRVMRMAMLTSVPVIDGYGVLQADLCVADITGIRPDDSVKALLALTVLDFLKTKNGGELKHTNLVPSTVTPASALRDAMGKKSVARNHRLYIAEQRREGVSPGLMPIGVVALSDVLRMVVKA